MRGLRTILVGFALAIVCLGATAARPQLLQALKISRNNQPPPFAFDARRAPAPVAYDRPASWIALPDTRDEADVTPRGVTGIDQRRAPVDVFFIYPTVLMSRTQWNADPRDVALNAKIAATTIRNQASVFNGCCAVYAPRYRQMTLGGYIKWSDDSVPRPNWLMATWRAHSGSSCCGTGAGRSSSPAIARGRGWGGC